MTKVCNTSWCYDCKDQVSYSDKEISCDTCKHKLIPEIQKSLFGKAKETISDADQLAYWEDQGAFNKY